MTHASLAPRARPNVVIAALTALNQSPPAAIADRKLIDVGNPPRDLSDVYTSAVCVQVPDFDTATMTTAMNLLTGSTMNGQVLTEGDARKLLADKKVYDDAVALFDFSPVTDDAALALVDDDGNKAGKSCVQDGVAKKRIGGLTIGHHHEPRRVAGKPCNRGEHVAIH